MSKFFTRISLVTKPKNKLQKEVQHELSEKFRGYLHFSYSALKTSIRLATELVAEKNKMHSNCTPLQIKVLRDLEDIPEHLVIHVEGKSDETHLMWINIHAVLFEIR